MSTVTLSLHDAEVLAVKALMACGTSEANARSVARALVAADADGLASHGLSRVPAYAAQAKSGKVDGKAVPDLQAAGSAALRIDARDGFAYPALDLAVAEAIARTPQTGVLAIGIAQSHHFGAAGYHVERLAAAGLIGLAFSNSPAAMAPWGGTTPILGTNPIAFACPAEAGQPPLVVDLSLSEVARGKIMVAAQKGEAIPTGWALDAAGQPTTDAKAALAGSMLPMGGAKGAALALVVEILSAALTGSNFGHEAGSFFTADGPKPRIGQLLLAFNPGPLSGGAFSSRIATLLHTILDQDGTRLPGARRLANRAKAARDGVSLPAALHQEIAALAG